jgi:hypothetical protein
MILTSPDPDVSQPTVSGQQSELHEFFKAPLGDQLKDLSTEGHVYLGLAGKAKV